MEIIMIKSKMNKNRYSDVKSVISPHSLMVKTQISYVCNGGSIPPGG